MENILVILAAGKATRFGGLPKAFALIENRMNVVNTIEKASPCFSSIYLVINEEVTFTDSMKSALQNISLIKINTGNGEAHSLLRSLYKVKKEKPNAQYITLCWGDAFFVDSSPFVELLAKVNAFPKDGVAWVACSYDRFPYAWFEVENGDISKALFKSQNEETIIGIHDQSLFYFDVDRTIRYLEEYKKLLQIPDEYSSTEREMKLLSSFEYLYNSANYPPARCVMITGGKVFSFNTVKELNEIKKKY